MKIDRIRPRFVTFIPDEPEEGVLYISKRYGTAIHKCCCGCGEQVVTPLTPVDWTLLKEGNTVSLTPSIGNWDFSCRSHYWIRKNVVEWDSTLSDERIRTLQERQRKKKAEYLAARNAKRAARVSWLCKAWKRIRGER